MLFNPAFDKISVRGKLSFVIAVLATVCLTSLGCGRTYTVRAVHSSVYDGLDLIVAASDQVRNEALARYKKNHDRLVKYAPLIVEAEKRAGRENVTLEHTLKTLEQESNEFDAVMAQNSQISTMAEKVKVGLGWTVGPRHQFEDVVAPIGAGAAGVAVGAAAF